MAKPVVVVHDLPADLEQVRAGLGGHVAAVLDRLGGAAELLRSRRDVYVKPNGIDAKPFTHTRPEVLEAVIRYFLERGARRVFVIENSTQCNYTRLVFAATGYDAVCRRTGAVPIYLDEDATETLTFRGKPSVTERPDGYDRTTFELPRTVVRQLIERRDENLYVSLPKLKTHSMTGITLGIKNQWGFPAHAHRQADHNHNLHHKLVDVLEWLRPDVTLVDGVEGTVHGHYPAERLHDRCVVPFRVLVGGRDVVAVDLVGARILGLGPEDVPHLALAMERRVGTTVRGLDDVDVVGDLSRFTERQPTTLVPSFPPFMNLVEGEEMACVEGCRNNPLTLAQVLYLDEGGEGRFDLVFGKGHDPAAIDALEGPCLVAGHCAIEEVGERLVRRLGRRNVYFSDGCNNLAQTAAAMFRLMKVSPLRLVPLPPLRALRLVLQARWHGSRASVPPVLSRWFKYT